MQGLMIHTADGHRAGFNEICAVPVPERTKSYQPVAHEELVGFMRNRVELTLGLKILKEEYGLSRKDQQMFGVMTLDTGNKENGLSIGVRNSYDKSLSVGISSGAQVFVCDNLCFSGSAMVVLRKHTVNVWRDVTVNVDAALKDSTYHYNEMNRQLDALKALPCDEMRGFELIGRALGTDILRPQQATVALKDWKEARHEDFAERNIYSLYNCFTEGLKKGPAGDTMTRHSKAHEFFHHMIPSAPVLVGWE